MSNRRPLAGVAALSLFLAACSSSASVEPSLASPSATSVGSATASASAAATITPKPTPSPTPSPTPPPSPSTFDLNANVWWGGYQINVSGGTFDPLKHKLLIEATFLNTSTSANDVSYLGAELNVVWNATYVQGSIAVGAVPAGGTVRAEIQVQTPATFTTDAAVLTFGQPTEHQAMVPLNGGAATSEQPTNLTVTGTVKMGPSVTFAVTSGIVIPAACSGYANKVKYGPLKKDQVSVVLFGTASNADAKNDGTIDQAFVTAPDTTTATANPTVYLYLPSKATLRDNALCFDVAAPGSGKYTLSMHESRSKVTGTLAFQVP